MPLPSSQSAAKPAVKDAYEAMTAAAGAIRQRSIALSADVKTGTRDIGILVSYLRDLSVNLDIIAKRVGRAGVQNYARDQLNDNTLVLATEFAATDAATSAVIAWFVANLPQTAAGFLAYEKLATDGSISLRKLTIAEMATLAPLLDAIVATID